MRAGAIAAVDTLAADPGADWPIIGSGDHDGDRHSDVLWENARTGSSCSGARSAAAASRLARFRRRSAAGWQGVAVADFDGNGTSDVIWRRQATGEIAVSLFRAGADRRDATPHIGAYAGREVVGTGDFDGDGSTRTCSCACGGQCALRIWRMNGTEADLAHAHRRSRGGLEPGERRRREPEQPALARVAPRGPDRRASGPRHARRRGERCARGAMVRRHGTPTGTGSGASGGQRGRAERAAHAAPDPHAGARPRELLRAARREGRRDRRSRAAGPRHLARDPGSPAAGGARRHVHTVIVTHSHPDHFGGAARFAKEAGATVVAHRSFRFGPPVAARSLPEVSVEDLAAPRAAESGPTRARRREPHRRHARRSGAGGRERGLAAWLGDRTPWGGERPRPPLLTKLKWRVLRWLGSSIVPEITHPVEHGDVLGSRAASGSCCIPPATPRTTSACTIRSTGSSSPATTCCRRSRRTSRASRPRAIRSPRSSTPSTASPRSPASTHVAARARAPLRDLRARTEAIKRHHSRAPRQGEGDLARASARRPCEAFSHELFQPRSWGSMAESETYAHLEHLRIAGQAERHMGDTGKLIYETS